MARNVNHVILLGNLTRDPELRYTPNGTAVCEFGLATNRIRGTEGGERAEETTYHRIVAWQKLAELCSQLLVKGRKVYVEGRLANRKYTNKDGLEQTVTEVVIDDMILLDNKPVGSAASAVRSAETNLVDAHTDAKSRSEGRTEAINVDTLERTYSADEIADEIPF